MHRAMRRPRVLAMIDDRSPELARDELPAISAQLRGIGAELAIVAKSGAWLLGPDDPPLALHGRPEADRTFEVTDRQMLLDALAAAGEAVRTRAPITFTRREWALTSMSAGFALALFGCKGDSKHKAAPAPAPAPQAPPPQEYDIVLNVNGSERKLKVEARVSLLDALRERLGLTGTKKGCDHGQCGACTVHVDDRRIKSCMQLAIMTQGQK